ncbi:hypothetical protein ACOMHN_000941 [Nucella lapillus]
MEGKDGGLCPSESLAVQQFSIANIFKGIQQKLKGTSTPESSDSTLSATEPHPTCSPGNEADHRSEDNTTTDHAQMSDDNHNSDLSQKMEEDLSSDRQQKTDDDHNGDRPQLELDTPHGTGDACPERPNRVPNGLEQTERLDDLSSETTTETATHQNTHSEINARISSILPRCTEEQNDNMIIKQEVEDAGYEHVGGMCTTAGTREDEGEADTTRETQQQGREDADNEQGGGVTASTVCETERSAQVVQVKKEPFLPESQSKEGGEQGGDVVFSHISYRNPDDATNSDSDSDSDSSSLSSFGMEVQQPEPEREQKEKILRTKGEFLPEELPPLENLRISLTKETRLEELGTVTGVVGVLVIIESTVDLDQYSPLNDDTVLFYENRQPFGVVFEVFGPCKAPCYSVRFNSAEDIREKGVEIGLKVFFVPDPVPEVGTITHYVFVQKLKRIKGSDASWKGNNEPPDNLVEYSDDEDEKRSKAKRKADTARERQASAGPNARGSDDEIEGEGVKAKQFEPSRKKKAFSTHKNGRPWLRPERPDSGGSSRYPNTGPNTHNQQSSTFGQEQQQFTFRRDFPQSKPGFSRNSDTMSTPPPPMGSQGFLRHPGSLGPQTFGSRSVPPPEKAPVRGPFSGSSGQGYFDGSRARSPFSDHAGSTHSGDGRSKSPFMDGPSSGFFGGGPGRGSFNSGPFKNPGSGSFGGPPFKNPSGGSFAGPPFKNSGSGSFGGPPFKNPSGGSFAGPPFKNSGSGSFAGPPFKNPGSGSFSVGPHNNPDRQSSFSTDPARTPFSNSSTKEPFRGPPFSKPPPPAGSAFPRRNTSIPPPNLFVFSAGQTNSSQQNQPPPAHPPPSTLPPPSLPPPPSWIPSPSPAFTMGAGDTSASSQSSRVGGGQFSFGSNPGQFSHPPPAFPPPPSQVGFGVTSPPAGGFQGQPQFAQYHGGQSWK